MLRMCRQYLALVARKLRYELPKMVSSDLRCSPAELEAKLKEMLEPQVEEILQGMTAEPAQVRDEREKIENKLSVLNRVSFLLKASGYALDRPSENLKTAVSDFEHEGTPRPLALNEATGPE